MNTSLTTHDGFPRADIDVAQIRTTRARIIRLKTDYKELMKRLEAAVEEQFAAGKTAEPLSGQQTQLAAATASTSSNAMAIEPPFAKVNSVAPNSPAASAGLVAGDRVTRFGIVNWTNHERLSKVAQVVQQNENVRFDQLALNADHDADGFAANHYCEGAQRYGWKRFVFYPRASAHTTPKLGRSRVTRMPSRPAMR